MVEARRADKEAARGELRGAGPASRGFRMGKRKRKFERSEIRRRELDTGLELLVEESLPLNVEALRADNKSPNDPSNLEAFLASREHLAKDIYEQHWQQMRKRWPGPALEEVRDLRSRLEKHLTRTTNTVRRKELQDSISNMKELEKDIKAGVQPEVRYFALGISDIVANTPRDQALGVAAFYAWHLLDAAKRVREALARGDASHAASAGIVFGRALALMLNAHTGREALQTRNARSARKRKAEERRDSLLSNAGRLAEVICSRVRAGQKLVVVKNLIAKEKGLTRRHIDRILKDAGIRISKLGEVCRIPRLTATKPLRDIIRFVSNPLLEW